MKLLLTLLLAVSAPFAVAQQNTNQNTNKNTEDSSEKSYFDEEDHRRFWQASLPGGEFVVALDRISSISKHEYVLDGNLLVTEVSIDTNGNALTRIYQITPVAERSNLATAQKMVERGTSSWTKSANAPATTSSPWCKKNTPSPLIPRASNTALPIWALSTPSSAASTKRGNPAKAENSG